MDWLLQLDGNILLWIQEYIRQDFMNGFWKFITSLGNGGWFWIVLSLVLCAIPKTRKAGVMALCSMALCAIVVNLGLKNIVARPRPYTQVEGLQILIAKPTDFSFPSGHTTASFAAAWCYFRMLPKKFGVPALVLAVFIALSRLYVGVHYPTDVLGGLIIGTLGSFVVYLVAKKMGRIEIH
ncbi:MAG: phosphatase PAP2 family protein [Lachnospiraceae bacterium]|nr:phosphatase PAP2 family protein [Lachnospiraceae bacterium]MDD3617182.1 phosphatase PAP2 family protein [Lachnospiraceae bacterium]